MKIHLIYPLLSKKRSRVDENKQFWPPLGTAYVAAALENEGHEVRIIDRDVLLRKMSLDFDKTDNETLREIINFSPDYIGISATTPNMLDVGYISKKIKEELPDVPIILGGPHVTAIPIDTLNEFQYIDIGIIGEGEKTITEILGNENLCSIKGIAFRKKREIVLNEPRPHIENIDDLPLPARHLLDMEFYLRPSRFTSRNLNFRTTSIFTARGCPYRCDFCASPVIFPGRVRYHSKERVLQEINELVSRYNVEALYFAEDMFLSNKQRAVELLEGFLISPWSKKLKWFAQARVNVIDRSILDLMKEAGCVGVEYGFESGSQRVLNLMNKRASVEENRMAASLTRKANLRFQANIIVGYPGEKEEDFQETIDFIKKIKPNNIGFNIFMPLPGTSIYNKIKAEGKTIPPWDEIGDPEGTGVSYADMSKERFYELYFKARLKVILPLNLYYFIKDNLHNPPRLIWIILSQFKGVIVKTFNALKKLAPHRKSYEVLYVSYNAVSDPVFQSQGISYLKGLAKAGLGFLLLTFEKQSAHIYQTKKALKDSRLDWQWLKYHKKPNLFSTLWDILCGNIYITCNLCRYRIQIIHARGVIAATMSFLPALLFRCKFIFDIRSSLAEAYASAGHWDRGGITYKSVKFLESLFIRYSDFLIVETSEHAGMVSRSPLSRSLSSVEIIPCCVDLERFRHELVQPYLSGLKVAKEGFKLLYIGSLSGWYMLNEMLDFFKSLKEIIPGAQFIFLTNDEHAQITNEISRDKVLSAAVHFEPTAYNELASKAVQMNAGIVFAKPMQRLESMPVKMGEYLASGLPVIANKGMGDAEQLIRQHRAGVILEKFNEEGYRKAALELLGLTKEGAQLKQRCRNIAEDYLSLDIGIKKYDKIYRGLI